MWSLWQGEGGLPNLSDLELVPVSFLSLKLFISWLASLLHGLAGRSRAERA